MEQFAVETLGARGTVEAPETVPPVPMGMEARRDLYLLFTEALHNAVRHSDASHIEVEITASGGRVAFTVADDGCGFDPEAVAGGPGSTRGRGLGTMRRRADALGGTLAWSPREGGGTVVTFAANLG
jgi:signal transduction histidine kinase